MKRSRWKAIGMIASAILAAIAAFLGVAALFLLVSLIIEVARFSDQDGPELFEALGWIVFLVVSLIAAATPFVAWNTFYDLHVNGSTDPANRTRLVRTGWMMAVVAIPWWVFSAPVTWDNIVHFQGVAHTVLQTVLTSTPAVLATLCAVSAFRLARSNT